MWVFRWHILRPCLIVYVSSTCVFPSGNSHPLSFGVDSYNLLYFENVVFSLAF